MIMIFQEPKKHTVLMMSLLSFFSVNEICNCFVLIIMVKDRRLKSSGQHVKIKVNTIFL